MSSLRGSLPWSLCLASLVATTSCRGGATADDGSPVASPPDARTAVDVVVAPSDGVVAEVASDDGTTAPSDAAAEASAPAAACIGKRAQPVDRTITVRSGGRDRTALVHVPVSYDSSRPTPVVLDFHAFLSDAGTQDAYAGMSAKANSAGFIAVHPQGIANSWNAGACCGQAASDGVDDIGFVRDLLDELELELCVDVHRVFATGMSNGAFFAHRVGCELADRIAAIAPVAGVLGVTRCEPLRPVPVLQFHGTADGVVPFDGSTTLGFASVQSTLDRWRALDGCGGDLREVFRDHDSHCSVYLGCRKGADVELCTVEGGGHSWPGGVPVAGVTTTTYLRATDVLWEFFRAHPMP